MWTETGNGTFKVLKVWESRRREKLLFMPESFRLRLWVIAPKKILLIRMESLNRFPWARARDPNLNWSASALGGNDRGLRPKADIPMPWLVVRNRARLPARKGCIEVPSATALHQFAAQSGAVRPSRADDRPSLPQPRLRIREVGRCGWCGSPGADRRFRKLPN